MSDDGMTVRPVAACRRRQCSAAAAGRAGSTPSRSSAPVDIEAGRAAARELSEAREPLAGVHVDDASGRMVCSVRDAETGDLIRQIPNEEVLRLAELAHDETIVLVNERA